VFAESQPDLLGFAYVVPSLLQTQHVDKAGHQDYTVIGCVGNRPILYLYRKVKEQISNKRTEAYF
jgi:hypothetical protein